jgi:cellulose synthase/poly-beta-1,6-N-acetylglucosamine synthase-like glycosyltransferase
VSRPKVAKSPIATTPNAANTANVLKEVYNARPGEHVNGDSGSQDHGDGGPGERGSSGARVIGELMMLVSVVIPTLARPKLLLRAIDSVLRQTYQEIEVIVVVDEPDPDTVSAVQSVDDPRLQLIRSF